MMRFEANPELIAEIRQLKESGKRSADILHFLSEHGVIPGMGLIMYFCEAFNLRFDEAAVIGGWSPDGMGELSDEAINVFLDKAIRSHAGMKPDK